ncbi:MAG: zinc carboxypeptidase, partial [Bacteroidota bacterium]
YYFEQVLDYPATHIEPDQLSYIPMEDYNLLVISDGRYRWNERTQQRINNWINNGGRLIAIGSAIRALDSQDGFAIDAYADDSDQQADRRAREEAQLEGRLNAYGEQSERYATRAIPGAIFKVNLDQTHPLAFGLGDYYFSLKTGTSYYQHQLDVWNVGTLGEALFYQGFVGQQAAERMKNTLVFGSENKGRGSVTYFVDNPLFRAFWENGQFLFSNAVFFVGN